MELLPSFWPHRAIALGAFVWFGKRGSLTRRPLLPLNAGTAEPVRVSPPEAVAYPLEVSERFRDIALPHFKAFGMVLNGAYRVSSRYTTDNIPMPRLRWGVAGGDSIPSTPCERRKR